MRSNLTPALVAMLVVGAVLLLSDGPSHETPAPAEPAKPAPIKLYLFTADS